MAEAAEKAKVMALRKVESRAARATAGRAAPGPARPARVAGAGDSWCAGACSRPGRSRCGGDRLVLAHRRALCLDRQCLCPGGQSTSRPTWPVWSSHPGPGQRAGHARARCCSPSTTPTYRSALASAEAKVGMAATELEALQASYAQSAGARSSRRRATSRTTTKEHQRQSDLATRRVDAAGAARRGAARSGLGARRAGGPASRSRPASRRSSAATRRRRSSSIRATWRRWPHATGPQHDLDHTVVRASIDGMTARVPSLQPGEYLDAGQAAFALVATDHVWIEANPKETDLT